MGSSGEWPEDVEVDECPGGWIRVRHGLEEEPEVVRVALRLQRSPVEIVGRLIRLWSWFATRTEDGLTHVADDRVGARAWIDEMVGGLPGMAEALEEVGWLEIEPGGETRIPQSTKWVSSKKRGRRLARERKRAQRAREEGSGGVKRDMSVTSSVTERDIERDMSVTKRVTPRSRSRSRSSSTAESQSQEPSGPLPAASPKGPAWYRAALTWPLPEELEAPEVRGAWEAWVETRKALGAPLTTRACEMAVAKLSELGADLALESLETSTERSWRGLFDPRDRLGPKKTPGEDALAEYDRNKKTERYLERLRREG